MIMSEWCCNFWKKLEESLQQLAKRLLIRSFVREPSTNLLDFRIVPLKIDKNYVELKNIVIKTERRLLNVLGFVVHVQHPHKLIYAYMHVLQLLDRKDILYKAW